MIKKKQKFRISENTFQIKVEEQQLCILKILTKIKRYFYSRATINAFFSLFCLQWQVTVKPNFSIFLTICSNGHNYEFPPEVRALFRSVAMVMPDTSLILRAHCAGQGFKSPKILADRLKLVADVCKEQL